MKTISPEMKRILYANTRKLIIEEGSLEGPDNIALALTVNRNLERFGVTLDASALRALSTQTAEEMSKTWREIEGILSEVSGYQYFQGELFYPNFPEEVMAKTDAELYLNSLFYYAFAQTNDKLSIAVAEELRANMVEPKKQRLPLLEQFPRELSIINKGTEADLLKMMNDRMHSLNMSEAQFAELKRFSEVYRKEFDAMLESPTPFQSKETKVKIAMMLHENRRDHEIAYLLKDAVDVLRFAAMLSYEHGQTQNNVELKPQGDSKPIAFKLNNAEKRLIRGLLNQCAGLYTDIWHQEDLFKKLMNRLGTTKADNCPVRVTLAFDNLALGHKVDERGRPIYNPNKLIPDAIAHLNKTGDPSKLHAVAESRPGDFLRTYMSSVAHTNPQYRQMTIDAIRYCAASTSIPLKNLLTVRESARLQGIANEKAESGEQGVKIYKHHGKRYVKENNGVNLTAEDIDKMREVLMETASRMVAGYQDLGKVYIDPALAGVKAPGREMRDASGGSVLTPYSTIDLDEKKNLMMFGIRWERTKENPSESWIDVDLSVHMYGANYENKGFVSYSNLRSDGVMHSGDYTHVVSGGSSTEAIVADKAKLRAMGVKYLVAEAHCFSIESFKKAGNCKFVYEQKEGSFADYEKIQTSSRYARDYGDTDIICKGENGSVMFLGETFEPSQLENCITLNSDGQTTVPLFVDVENGRIHWLDMTLTHGRGMPSVTEDPKKMSEVMAEIALAQQSPCPSMADLFECYAGSNGTIVTDMKDADTVFVRENIDREQLGIAEHARVITGFELDTISKEFSGNDNLSLQQEEPSEEQKVQEIKEHPLIAQMRYLHHKLAEFPAGHHRMAEDPFIDDYTINR